MDHRLYREWGRAPRGERIYEAVAGKRRERTSIIAASQNRRLVAPLVFQGSATRRWWTLTLKKCCCPRCPRAASSSWTTRGFTSPRPPPHWWPPPVASCCSCRPIRPTSTPLNIFGPASRPAFAKTSPPPPTRSFLSPICPNVIVNCYMTDDCSGISMSADSVAMVCEQRKTTLTAPLQPML